MNFVAVARGWNVRAVPWLTWLLLAFGVVYFGLGVLLFQLAKSIVYPTLTALGWAFVFAAALESLRSLTLVGTGLCFANVVVGTVLLWWNIGPNANTDLLSLIISGPLLLGWLALTAGALRGELDEPGPGGSGSRSRAGRGSGARRRAG